MCVLLEQELAAVGVINAIAMSEMIGEEIEDIRITSYDVMNYSNYLSRADCGPIIRRFDEYDIKLLFDSKDFIKRDVDDSFVIVIEDLRKGICINDNKFGIEEFLRALMNEFDPNLNYPRKFLRFMDLCK